IVILFYGWVTPPVPACLARALRLRHRVAPAHVAAASSRTEPGAKAGAGVGAGHAPGSGPSKNRRIVIAQSTVVQAEARVSQASAHLMPPVSVSGHPAAARGTVVVDVTP